MYSKTLFKGVCLLFIVSWKLAREYVPIIFDKTCSKKLSGKSSCLKLQIGHQAKLVQRPSLRLLFWDDIYARGFYYCSS